jgi:hypothetical protein
MRAAAEQKKQREKQRKKKPSPSNTMGNRRVLYGSGVDFSTVLTMN